jgi:hypothetical protein
MTRTDRALLAAAVLSGVLLAQGPLRGGPDAGGLGCGPGCQPTQTYYDCVTGAGYFYEKGDCLPCAQGLCKNPPNDGTACVMTDEVRKVKNATDVSLYCPCDGTGRAQAAGTVRDEDPWEENPFNKYWVCTGLLHKTR